MTALFATSYGIFKKQMADLSDAEFGEQFAAALAKSVQQFKTDGAAMQQAIESAGAGAVKIGMTMTEQMTLLGMMQQQMQAGEAGTALRAFATNAAKAHKAFDNMKVTTERPVKVRILDENGQLRAMPDILTDLKARYGETLDAFEADEIKTAFGTDEAMKMINALYGQEAAVRANAAALDEAAQQGDEFTRSMARAADNNWDSAMVLMSQKMDVLRQKIGERLLPAVERLLPIFDAFIERAFAWVDANPGLIAGIGAVVVGLGALSAVLAPLLLGAGTLIATWATMSFALTKGTAAMLAFASGGSRATGLIARIGRGLTWLGRRALPLLAKGILLLGRAMMANPILAAIGLVAAGALLIVQNWEVVSAFFVDLWANVLASTESAWEGIKSLFYNYTPLGLIISNWQGIKGFFANLWQGIKDGISSKWEAIKAKLKEYGPAGLIKAAWDGVVDWFGSLWDRVKAKFTAITWADILPDWDWGFITEIDMSEWIKWPEPPEWLSYLMNGGHANDPTNPANAAPVNPSDLSGTRYADLAKQLEALLGNQELPTQSVIRQHGAHVLSLRDEVADLEAQIADLKGSADQAQIERLEADLTAKRAELKGVEQAAADVVNRANALKALLQEIMGTDVDIQINMAAIDAALAKLREVARLQGQVSGGSAGSKPQGPVQKRAKGGWYGKGWLLTGEQGPELRYASEGGFIAHNRALRGMMDMAGRTRAMLDGVGLGGAGAEAMPASIPAMAALAPIGAPAAAPSLTFAPVTNMPPLSLDGGVNLEEAQALFAAMLEESQERIKADWRASLHDL